MAHRCDHGWVCPLPNSFMFMFMFIFTSFPSIHERSAREKISTDQVAHVLNDEVSRKYIQSLKRYLDLYYPEQPLTIPQTFDVLTNKVPTRRRLTVDGINKGKLYSSIISDRWYVLSSANYFLPFLPFLICGALVLSG